MPESLLLVDDSRAIRTLVRRRLKNAGFVVCGEASDGMEALEQATELSLDLVVMDFSMPRLSWLDAARVLRHKMSQFTATGHSPFRSTTGCVPLEFWMHEPEDDL